MTPPRRGLIRLIRVCCVLVAAGYGAWWLYDYALKPGEVRRRVVEQLTAKFDGVDVEVGSARMRPFLGGVNITELNLIRRDDPTRTPFLHVPKATIWFDRSLNLTKLPIGKIELDDAHIRLVRDIEGRWNVQGVMNPAAKGDGPLPVLVLKKARISVVDQKQGVAGELNIRDTDLTVVNDPATLYTVEAKGEADPFGKFRVAGKYETNVGATGQLDIKDATVGPALGKLLGMAKPEAADALDGLDGRLALAVKWDWKVGQPPARGLDVAMTLSGATYRHPDLPAAITDLAATIRFRDGDLTAEPVTGKLAGADFRVALDMDFRDTMATAGPPPDVLGTINERIRKLDVAVNDLQVGPDLFAMLPPKYVEIHADYLPKGPADITFEQRRASEKTLRKVTVRPKDMSAMYKGFPYPVDHIRGTIDATLNPDEPTKLTFDLAGTGNGQPVTLKGTVLPEPENKDVDLLIAGPAVALDKALIAALPGTIPKFVDSLRATAGGGFTVKIRHNARTRREHGPKVFDNEFDIAIRDARADRDASGRSVLGSSSREKEHGTGHDERASPGDPQRGDGRVAGRGVPEGRRAGHVGAVAGVPAAGALRVAPRRAGHQAEDGPDAGAHQADRTDREPQHPLRRGSRRRRRLRRRVLGRSARGRDGRRSRGRAQDDALAAPLLSLLDDERLCDGGLAGLREDEDVAARIDPHGGAVQTVREELPVEGGRHVHEIVACGVLGVEDDGRLRLLQLVEPLRAVVTDHGGARRVRAFAEALAGRRELAGSAQVLGARVGAHALVLGDVRGDGGRCEQDHGGCACGEGPPRQDHRHSFLNTRVPLAS